MSDGESGSAPATVDAPADATATDAAPTAPEDAAAVDAASAVPPQTDEVLLGAVDLARAALLDITTDDTIGEPVGHRAVEDHVLSLYFACTLSGYPGWHWTVSLSRIDENAEPFVLETELTPGDDALLAPDWVPWSERLADYRAAQELAAAEAAEAQDAEGDDDDEDIDEDDLDEDDVDELDDLDDEVDEDDLDDDHGDDELDGIDFADAEAGDDEDGESESR